MAYLYLTLSAGCSLTVAHFLKLTETRETRSLNTLTVNYLVALIVAFIVGIGEGKGDGPIISETGYLLLFCGIIGTLFIANFLVYGKSVHVNGVGVTITAMRLSLLIPVVLSILLYGEPLNILTSAGIILVLGSLLLLIPTQTNLKIRQPHISWLLLTTFLLSGLADASLKIYHEDFSMQLNELMFMGFVFVGAFLIGLAACLYRGGPLFTKNELLLGGMIGIPNLYSSIFLIYALNGVRGAVAFPIVNTMNVLGGTFLGLLIWKDQVSFRQWIGITTAIAAILLLVLG